MLYLEVVNDSMARIVRILQWY